MTWNPVDDETLSWINDAIRPNVHIGCHYDTFCEEYGLASNLARHSGESTWTLDLEILKLRQNNEFKDLNADHNVFVQILVATEPQHRNPAGHSEQQVPFSLGHHLMSFHDHEPGYCGSRPAGAAISGGIPPSGKSRVYARTYEGNTIGMAQARERQEAQNHLYMEEEDTSPLPTCPDKVQRRTHEASLKGRGADSKQNGTRRVPTGMKRAFTETRLVTGGQRLSWAGLASCRSVENDEKSLGQGSLPRDLTSNLQPLAKQDHQVKLWSEINNRPQENYSNAPGPPHGSHVPRKGTRAMDETSSALRKDYLVEDSSVTWHRGYCIAPRRPGSEIEMEFSQSTSADYLYFFVGIDDHYGAEMIARLLAPFSPARYRDRATRDHNKNHSARLPNGTDGAKAVFGKFLENCRCNFVSFIRGAASYNMVIQNPELPICRSRTSTVRKQRCLKRHGTREQETVHILDGQYPDISYIRLHVFATETAPTDQRALHEVQSLTAWPH
ncbi:hypothetical protein CPLU01_03016 [Colletotrichum plurivorum]|uniref:Uncharacterized protein n=1 Tax=Colletotrichum plurivorum TaxID=2175906 RepID=A0A8H6NKW5_9PEZI|nr:hypothetical protein CPLU01_03016 [Colletotrichum plurivorum]